MCTLSSSIHWYGIFTTGAGGIFEIVRCLTSAGGIFTIVRCFTLFHILQLFISYIFCAPLAHLCNWIVMIKQQTWQTSDYSVVV